MFWSYIAALVHTYFSPIVLRASCVSMETISANQLSLTYMYIINDALTICAVNYALYLCIIV